LHWILLKYNEQLSWETVMSGAVNVNDFVTDPRPALHSRPWTGLPMKKILVILLLPLIMFPLLKKKSQVLQTDRLNEWKSIIWYCILPSFRITHFEDLIDRVYYLNLRAALKEKCVLFRLFNEKVNPPSSYKPRFLQFLSSWPKQKQ